VGAGLLQAVLDDRVEERDDKVEDHRCDEIVP